MAKLADASDLGSDAARRGGSSPSIRTTLIDYIFILSMKFKYFTYFFNIALLSFISNSYANDAAKDNKISILMNQFYHGDEVTDVSNGENWIALINSDRKIITKHIKLKVKTVQDPITDEDKKTFTGKEISSDKNALFLVKGIELKNNSIIETYFFYDWQKDINDTIYSDKSIEIKGKKSSVKLFNRSDLQIKGNGYEINDAYQLIAKIEGKEIPLTAPTQSDDNFPNLIWSGDLNNDGHPDFVIDTAYHYNLSRPTLFLSHIEKDGVTYQKAAERKSSGC